MAFKIKDNLDLYGNQLLNFALQAESGFPSSPQKGHILYYTGSGGMSGHPVVCINPKNGSNAEFKALAYMDDVTNNSDFSSLVTRVENIEKELTVETLQDTIDTWEEIQQFFSTIPEGLNLVSTLNGKADKTQLLNYQPLISATSKLSYSLISGVPTKLSQFTDDVVSGKYLSLSSGGTITGAIEISKEGADSLVIRRLNSSAPTTITYCKDSTVLGRIGFDTDGAPVAQVDGNWREIIHGGNIGSQSVNYANSAGSASSATTAESANSATTALQWITTGSLNKADANSIDNVCGWMNNSTGSSNMPVSAGTIMQFGSPTLGKAQFFAGYKGQTSSSGAQGLYFRKYYPDYGWDSWKTIAFTDSDITGNAATATKLADNTAFSAWGQTFFENGKPKSVSGDIKLPNKNSIQCANAKGDYAGMFALNQWNELVIGYGARGDGFTTSIYGGTIGLFTGSAQRLTIANGGNVGIGIPNPEEKLHVVGNLYVTGNIIAGGEVSAGGAGTEGGGGTSGEGGVAEKIYREIKIGRTEEVIAHTLGDNVVVQIYEWNASGNCWDMILTDVEVKTNQVTVRFAKATDVLHKVVIL